MDILVQAEQVARIVTALDAPQSLVRRPMVTAPDGDFHSVGHRRLARNRKALGNLGRHAHGPLSRIVDKGPVGLGARQQFAVRVSDFVFPPLAD